MRKDSPVKMSKQTKCFLFLAVAVFIVGVWLRRPRFTTRMTAHATCQNLVAALRSGNQRQLQDLTTPHGFADLQVASRDRRVGSFAKLADRIKSEWIVERPLEFIDSNRGLVRTWNNPSSWFQRVPAPLKVEGMTHSADSTEGISFQRTPQGYKVDHYKLTNESIYQRYLRAVKIHQQVNARFAKAKNS